MHSPALPGNANPPGATLARYDDFFALFQVFRGYVESCLLQDLVGHDYTNVRFFMPFDDFKLPAVPRDAGTYAEYRRLSVDFVRARNGRIDAL